MACVHSEHEHETHTIGGLPYVREYFVELPHAAMEAFVGHDAASDLAGLTSGAVGVLAGVRAYQNLKMGGATHLIEGVGNLALAASSGISAINMISEAREIHETVEAHGHHHGAGIAALEIVHGIAEFAVGAIELKNGTAKPHISALRLAKGAAGVAAQIAPQIAGASLMVQLGTVAAIACLDPKH